MRFGFLAAAVCGLLSTASAWGHCDTVDGPVVSAARAALQSRNVTPVMKWIDAEYEPELRAAFERTLKVRAAGGEARELADTYFFETAVRLHRAGEGEPFTGLQPAGSGIDPAIRAADQALAQGTADDLVRRMTGEVAAGIRSRFEQARQARRMADRSVAEGRAYVAAYVELMHYLERLQDTAPEGGAH